ncbi:hypothetical protein MTQ10_18800 [Streptomyces sp. XM83C]|uniref:Integral membrane protein n=1 Tax=Streptomyces thermocoprophilus TaxID=78356 RepID=A0ABV5VD11_9ACTN|nr:hypothetical protein [Streptomyces sp. XM83C]MCK1821605.1 hypothetical protein [Streptomyces sp. XM83C]
MTTAPTPPQATYPHPGYRHTAYRPVVLPDPDRDRHAWIAPTAATVLVLVLAPLALWYCLVVATQPADCGGTGCGQARNTALQLVYVTLYVSPVVTKAALITSWALPRKRRWRTLRAWMAVVALLPVLFVLLLLVTLPAG